MPVALADSPCLSLQGTLEGLEEELLAFFSVTPHSVYTALMDNRYFCPSGSAERCRSPRSGGRGPELCAPHVQGFPAHRSRSKLPCTAAARLGSRHPRAAPGCRGALGTEETPRPGLGLWLGTLTLAEPPGEGCAGGFLPRGLWHFVLPVSGPWDEQGQGNTREIGV